jgi:hypothetical protein
MVDHVLQRRVRRCRPSRRRRRSSPAETGRQRRWRGCGRP